MSTAWELFFWIVGTAVTLALITVVQPKHERRDWVVWGGSFYLLCLGTGLVLRWLGWTL